MRRKRVEKAGENRTWSNHRLITEGGQFFQAPGQYAEYAQKNDKDCLIEEKEGSQWHHRSMTKKNTTELWI